MCPAELTLEQKAAHRRDDGEGDHEGSEDRNHVGQRERLKESSLEPLKKQERQEDHHNNHCRKDHRGSDLITGVKNHLCKWATIGFNHRTVLFEASKDILYINDRVIDQNTNRDSQATESHYIEPKLHRIHHQQTDSERNRNSRERNERRS